MVPILLILLENFAYFAGIIPVAHRCLYILLKIMLA